MGKGNYGTRSTSWRDKQASVSLDERIVNLINGYNRFQKVSADISITRQEARALSDKLETNYDNSASDVIEKFVDEESYVALAAALSNGTLNDEQRRMVSVIDAQMKPIEKDVIVYRTTLKGNESGNKSYLSTSLNPRTSLSYRTRNGDKESEIHAYLIPKGTRALVINGQDQEVILPRGFNIKRYRIKSY